MSFEYPQQQPNETPQEALERLEAALTNVTLPTDIGRFAEWNDNREAIHTEIERLQAEIQATQAANVPPTPEQLEGQQLVTGVEQSLQGFYLGIGAGDALFLDLLEHLRLVAEHAAIDPNEKMRIFNEAQLACRGDNDLLQQIQTLGIRHTIWNPAQAGAPAAAGPAIPQPVPVLPPTPGAPAPVGIPVPMAGPAVSPPPGNAAPGASFFPGTPAGMAAPANPVNQNNPPLGSPAGVAGPANVPPPSGNAAPFVPGAPIIQGGIPAAMAGPAVPPPQPPQGNAAPFVTGAPIMPGGIPAVMAGPANVPPGPQPFFSPQPGQQGVPAAMAGAVMPVIPVAPNLPPPPGETIPPEGNAILTYLVQAMREPTFNPRMDPDAVARFVEEVCRRHPTIQVTDQLRVQVMNVFMAMLAEAIRNQPVDVDVQALRVALQASVDRLAGVWIRRNIIDTLTGLARGTAANGAQISPYTSFGESAQTRGQFAPNSFARIFYDFIDNQQRLSNHPFTPEEIEEIRRGVLKHFYIQSRNALRGVEGQNTQPQTPVARVRNWFQAAATPDNQRANDVRSARELYDRNRAEYVAGELEQVIAAKTAQTDQEFNRRQPLQAMGRFYGRMGDLNLEALGERMGLLSSDATQKASASGWQKAGRWILKMASVRTLMMAGLAGLTGPLGVRAMASTGAGLLAAEVSSQRTQGAEEFKRLFGAPAREIEDVTQAQLNSIYGDGTPGNPGMSLTAVNSAFSTMILQGIRPDPANNRFHRALEERMIELSETEIDEAHQNVLGTIHPAVLNQQGPAMTRAMGVQGFINDQRTELQGRIDEGSRDQRAALIRGAATAFVAGAVVGGATHYLMGALEGHNNAAAEAAARNVGPVHEPTTPPPGGTTDVHTGTTDVIPVTPEHGPTGRSWDDVDDKALAKLGHTHQDYSNYIKAHDGKDFHQEFNNIQSIVDKKGQLSLDQLEHLRNMASWKGTPMGMDAGALLEQIQHGTSIGSGGVEQTFLQSSGITEIPVMTDGAYGGQHGGGFHGALEHMIKTHPENPYLQGLPGTSPEDKADRLLFDFMDKHGFNNISIDQMKERMIGMPGDKMYIDSHGKLLLGLDSGRPLGYAFGDPTSSKFGFDAQEKALANLFTAKADTMAETVIAKDAFIDQLQDPKSGNSIVHYFEKKIGFLNPRLEDTLTKNLADLRSDDPTRHLRGERFFEYFFNDHRADLHWEGVELDGPLALGEQFGPPQESGTTAATAPTAKPDVTPAPTGTGATGAPGGYNPRIPDGPVVIHNDATTGVTEPAKPHGPAPHDTTPHPKAPTTPAPHYAAPTPVHTPKPDYHGLPSPATPVMPAPAAMPTPEPSDPRAVPPGMTPAPPDKPEDIPEGGITDDKARSIQKESPLRINALPQQGSKIANIADQIIRRNAA